MVAEVFFNYLRDAIYNPAKAELDLEKLPSEFQDFAKGLVYYTGCMQEVTNMVQDLAKGNLHGKVPSSDNETAAPLKSLCASLRHLTWQTQQVAQGDYSQRVHFMGEFAASFNVMVEQLESRQKALIEEIEHGNRKMMALTQSKKLFETIAVHVAQWVIVMDRKEKIWRYANHPAYEILVSTELENQLVEWLRQQVEETATLPRTDELELHDDDAGQYFRVDIHPLHWQDQEALAFILTDVSTGRTQIEKLERMAYRDPLTKTYNRRYGMELLANWLEKRKDFVLCFVDMDNLKYVNDRFGHNEGDTYIMSVADVLRQFSNSAIVSRLGGDEFMLLATGWNEEMASKRMEKLRDALSARDLKSEREYNHSISYGLVEVCTDNQLTASELLSRADEKMYAYKRLRKTHFTI